MSAGHNRPSSKGKEVFSHVLTDRYGQVQNVKAARVYVFGEGNMVDDDLDENVEFEMPSIRSIRARRGQNDGGGTFQNADDRDSQEALFYEKEIAPGDTLQSLSLKYACPVSELKRVNNLINDQDFFALRKLKIPMRHHGILSDMAAKEQQEEATPAHQKSLPYRNGAAALPSDSDITSDAGAYSEGDASDAEPHHGLLRTGNRFSRQGRKADKFLKKVDRDLSKLRESSVAERESLDEVISVLTNKSVYPLESSRRKVSGADYGIRWWVILACAGAVAVVVPAVYYIYVNFIQ